MLHSDKNFIKYYDKIFANKDYKKETDYILKQFEKHSKIKIKHILDVGCGTGSHTLEFANRGYNIIGMDLDPSMLEKAQQKSKKIKFIYGNIYDYKFKHKFELIYAYFNVINYISDLFELKKFFEGIYKNLENDGILAFDGWNGNRIPVDPPKEKDIYIKQKDFIAKGILYSNYDAFNNIAKFEYNININTAENIVKYKNILIQTYWPPLIIKQILSKVGYKKINIYKHLSNKIATETDYKLSWVCKK